MIRIKTVALHIGNARRAKNITQRELAGLLNVSPQAVSKWERGIAFPDLALIDELADQIGLSIEELLLEKKQDN